MKKIYFFLFLAFAPFAAKAQCNVIASFTSPTCNGACDAMAVAVPQGVGPFAFVWQPGNLTGQTVTGLCAGAYTVVMIDSGGPCTATFTFNITQPQPLNALAVTQPASCATCCDGIGVGTASGGTPPYSYIWLPSNQFVPSVTNLCVGSHTFCVTDANGCVSCDTVNVSFTTGINEESNSAGINVRPNPAQNSISVTASDLAPGEYSLSVYDLAGKLIESRNNTNQAVLLEEFDVSAYPSGMYFIRLNTANSVSVQRFVRE